MISKDIRLEYTKDLMMSSSYKSRLVAEYYQLKIRLDGLKEMLKNWDYARENNINVNEYLGFEPSVPYNVLLEQLIHMRSYLRILESRLKIEKVELWRFEK